MSLREITTSWIVSKFTPWNLYNPVGNRQHTDLESPLLGECGKKSIDSVTGTTVPSTTFPAWYTRGKRYPHLHSNMHFTCIQLQSQQQRQKCWSQDHSSFDRDHIPDSRSQGPVAINMAHDIRIRNLLFFLYMEGRNISAHGPRFYGLLRVWPIVKHIVIKPLQRIMARNSEVRFPSSMEPLAMEAFLSGTTTRSSTSRRRRDVQGRDRR